MDILKTATDWAKAEVFSSSFFILFGMLFLCGSIGFWQLGKTELAKAFQYPLLVTGALLLIIGIGLVYSNSSRLSSFPTQYEENASAFYASEMERVQSTSDGFKNVFRVIPMIIIVAGFLILFVDKPLWRAIGISTIAMMMIIMLIDTNSEARIVDYGQKLKQLESSINK